MEQFILAKTSFVVINCVHLESKSFSHMMTNGLGWNRLARNVVFAANIYKIQSNGELTTFHKMPNTYNITRKNINTK